MLIVKQPLAGSQMAPAFMIAAESLRQVRNPFCAIAILMALAALPGAALADHLTWHKFSRSYEVHLGVATAEMADRDAELRLMHETSPHGKGQRTAGTRHIMIAVFDRADKSRIVDADVIAEVVENDLIHVKRTEKALDASQLSAGTHYCNFFGLHWNGQYHINFRIRRPGKAEESVTFLQEENSL